MAAATQVARSKKQRPPLTRNDAAASRERFECDDDQQTSSDSLMRLLAGRRGGVSGKFQLVSVVALMFVTSSISLSTVGGAHKLWNLLPTEDRMSQVPSSSSAPINVPDHNSSEEEYAVKPQIKPNRNIHLVHVSKAGGEYAIKPQVKPNRTIQLVHASKGRDEYAIKPQIKPNRNIQLVPVSKARDEYAIKPQINPNRTIQLVHVGKAAGSTLRTAIMTRKVPVLSSQVRGRPFHIWSKNESLISTASSYLVTLRHPVERAVSTYGYSHPQNCPQKQELQSWGCYLKRKGWLNKSQSLPSRLFKTCFPTATMEDFAQSVGSPWKSSRHFANLTTPQQWKCRKLARYVAMGGNNANAAPHFFYNYNYYYKQTVGQYPNKQVLGVRTESQWEDLASLEVFVGGKGLSLVPGKPYINVTHGSETFKPSPLSQQAYHKLCCVLSDEIQLYVKILHRAENLSRQSKQTSLDKLYETCGIQSNSTSILHSDETKTPLPPWEEWITSCKQKLAADAAELDRMAPRHPRHANI